MARIDHGRPILKLIDDIRRRQRASARTSIEALVDEPQVRERISAASPSLNARHTKAEIHRCALSTLEHLHRHHDIRMPLRLIEAVSDNRMKNALRAWFCLFGKASLHEDSTELRFDKTKKSNLPAAMAKPYWKFIAARLEIAPS